MLGQPPIMFLIVKIIEESNLLQDCMLVLVIFKHSFEGTLNPICSCGFDDESTSQNILHCPMYNDERHALLSTAKNNARFEISSFEIVKILSQISLTLERQNFLA